MKLGLNLRGISFDSPDHPFLNALKRGAGWEPVTNASPTANTGEGVALYTTWLDSNGYPTTLSPTGGLTFNRVRVRILGGFTYGTGNGTGGSPNYQSGTYVFLYDGTGTFSFTDDFASGTTIVETAQNASAGTGRIVITNVTATSSGTFVRLTSTGAGAAYAKNFRLLYAGGSDASTTTHIGSRETALNAGEIFDPDWINLLKPFKGIRFMDWMETVNTNQKLWANRPTQGWVFWNDSRFSTTLYGTLTGGTVYPDGVPAEVMFALANKLNTVGNLTEAWFNNPPLADDLYVTNFASLAHTTLNVGITVYTEYANELWNEHLGPALGTEMQTVEQQVSNKMLDVSPAYIVCQFVGHISGTTLTVDSGPTVGTIAAAIAAGFAYIYPSNDKAIHQDLKIGSGSGSTWTVVDLAGNPAPSSTVASGTIRLTGKNYSLNTAYSRVRSCQTGVLWKTAWGADSGRVKRIFGGWSGNNGYNDSLGFTDDTGGSNYTGTVASNVDYVCVNPYVPSINSAVSTNVDDLFAELNGPIGTPSIAEVVKELGDNKTKATSYGVGLVCYEGGPNYAAGTDSFYQTMYAAANRDTRMGAMATTLLTGAASAGADSFFWYSFVSAYIGPPSFFQNFGYWGALENSQQTSAPKYDALVAYATGVTPSLPITGQTIIMKPGHGRKH